MRKYLDAWSIQFVTITVVVAAPATEAEAEAEAATLARSAAQPAQTQSCEASQSTLKNRQGKLGLRIPAVVATPETTAVIATMRSWASQTAPTGIAAVHIEDNQRPHLQSFTGYTPFIRGLNRVSSDLGLNLLAIRDANFEFQGESATVSTYVVSPYGACSAAGRTRCTALILQQIDPVGLELVT